MLLDEGDTDVDDGGDAQQHQQCSKLSLWYSNSELEQIRKDAVNELARLKRRAATATNKDSVHVDPLDIIVRLRGIESLDGHSGGGGGDIDHMNQMKHVKRAMIHALRRRRRGDDKDEPCCKTYARFVTKCVKRALTNGFIDHLAVKEAEKANIEDDEHPGKEPSTSAMWTKLQSRKLSMQNDDCSALIQRRLRLLQQKHRRPVFTSSISLPPIPEYKVFVASSPAAGTAVSPTIAAIMNPISAAEAVEEFKLTKTVPTRKERTATSSMTTGTTETKKNKSKKCQHLKEVTQNVKQYFRLARYGKIELYNI